jgi:hypothetical protein
VLRKHAEKGPEVAGKDLKRLMGAAKKVGLDLFN